MSYIPPTILTAPAVINERLRYMESEDYRNSNYPGIASVYSLFRTEPDFLCAMTGESRPNQQQHAWRLKMLNYENNIGPTADIIVQMDWYQQFVLSWLSTDLIDNVLKVAGLAPRGEADLREVHADDYMDAVDLLCRMAHAVYTERRLTRVAQSGISDMMDVMERAKSFIKDQTIRHDGCDVGKREFLEGTGLWDEDEVAEMFSREYTAYINVTMQIAMTREVPGGYDADDYFNEEITSSEVDEAVREFISYENADWEISSVEAS